MSHHLHLAEHLRGQGHRLTPQRLAVLEVIKAGPGHMSVNEVLERLKDQNPTMTVPTVYRNLQWLKRVELVAETDLGGDCHVYEYIAEDRHHHLVCTRCHAIVDLPQSFMDPVFESMRQEYGCAPSMKHVALFGVCSDCQRGEEAG